MEMEGKIKARVGHLNGIEISSSGSSSWELNGDCFSSRSNIKVKKLSESAKPPTKAHQSDIGYDLYSNDFIWIEPGNKQIIPTGIALSFPEYLYGKIEEKSGIASKTPLSLKAGVIDSGYQGEIKVVMFNHSNEPYQIKPLTPIAQLLIHKKSTDVEMVEVDDFEMSTDRGEKGFGSSYNI